MKSTLLAAVAAMAGVSHAARPIYLNPNATVEDRVADLLPRMSLREKASQLLQGDMRNYIDLETGDINKTGLDWTMEYRGHAVWTGLATLPEIVKKSAKVAQDYLVNETELGIPAYIQSEGLHGFLAWNATIFNSPIAMACAFNPELVEKMAKAIGVEAKALGVNQLFSPVVDLARELRFGRIEETFGEDAFLAGELGYHYVKGLQSTGVSAQVKHFAAFGMPEQGVNLAPIHGGPRELRRLYLTPFRRAIIDAEALSIMSSYNSYDDIPIIADHHILTEILRDEWDYKYFVISDAGATARLDTAFHVCPPGDDQCITMSALPAGNDVEMGGGRWSFENIPDLVKNGTLDESVVDTAVSRVLRAKFKQGIFEHPYTGVPDDEIYNYIHTDEHVALAQKIDEESIVLLENHDDILPLSKDANIAVIGPMAHGYTNYGDYVIEGSMLNDVGVTPFKGIQKISKGKVTFTQGCERWSNDDSGIPEAVAAAEAADVAVVVVGTWSRDQTELWQGLNATTGESVDVSSLNLVGAMPRLVQAVIDSGTPTIVVFSSGKPITEPWISKEAAALVQHFYQSEAGGHALARVLYGDVNPSGKLSVSFPYDVGTLPIYYDHANSARGAWPGTAHSNGTLDFGRSYILQSPLAQYTFGYGLSYSTFEFSDLSVSDSKPSASDTITVSVDVTNKSDRKGAEVVQLYVKDVIATVEVPRYTLRGFKKVFVEAGETETVEIELDVGQWGVYDRKMKYVVEPGEFVVLAGTSSEDFFGNVTVTVA